MILSSSNATFGLRATSPATSSGVVGNVSVGQAEEQVSLAPADTAWTAQILLVRNTAASTIALNIHTGTVTTATTWTAGAGQFEIGTIIAASGCMNNGTMTLVVTSAGMAGSPLNVPVPLTTTAHTDADLIAAAARTALAANATIAARFTVSGTAAAIVLTRIGMIYKMAGGDVQVHKAAADDATFSFTWPTALGVSGSPSDGSGAINTEGVLHRDADGKDWEGNTLTAIAAGRLGSLQVASSATSTGRVTAASTVGFSAMPLPPSGAVLVVAPKLDSTISAALTLTAATANTLALVHVTVVGSTV